MSQNVTKFEWNSRREQAAQLVAADNLTDEEIAGKLEIERRTLARWKTHPDFKAEVQRIVDETRERLLKRGLLERQNRLDALNDRWGRMREVINQRAEVYKDEPAGGNTGLIVRQVKGIGKGDDFQIVEMFVVDAGLLKELREHEKQAAQELGEWSERHEHTGAEGAPLFHSLAEALLTVYGGKSNSN